MASVTGSMIDSANDPALDLLARLADGGWHRGPVLSNALGVSRAAVWKQILLLRDAGLAIDSDRQRGYRLGRPIAMLSARRIASMLSGDIDLTVLQRTPSTSEALSGDGFAHRRAVLAEWQLAGRGRRGRTWSAPPGGSLALSFAYCFDAGLPELGPLSLVAGVACADALDSCGVRDLGLKWPNDLIVDHAKLGGLLVELQGGVDGPCRVVIGVGINAWLAEAARAAIDQPVTDLVAAGLEATQRNEVAAALIVALDHACDRFQREGFAPFRAGWDRYDLLKGREVTIHEDRRTRTAVAEGVSDRGGLWVETGGERQELTAGEVTLRVHD
jgi:BirA family biotin operon repressor/biotin-[acetyl-CoA-carboxylase] ligase